MKQHGPPLRKIDQFVHSFPLHGGVLEASDFDLGATLDSGQTFQWRSDSEGRRVGWIGGKLFRLWQLDRAIGFECMESNSSGGLAEYLQIDFDTASIKKFFLQRDPFLSRAVGFSPGLRVLKQDPWECLAGFILSSTKQVAHIIQIWAEVARRHGETVEWEGERHHRFPRPERLATLSEAELRQCKMGFRAKYLLGAARAVATGRLSLELPCQLTTREARSYLMRVPGVGKKIADCVLLFAYGKHDAFPRDVWIERILRRIYFRKRQPARSDVDAFISDYFGPYAGYAQQFLFHYVRMNPKSVAAHGD